jgi:hypothetical protein
MTSLEIPSFPPNNTTSSKKTTQNPNFINTQYTTIQNKENPELKKPYKNIKESYLLNEIL